MRAAWDAIAVEIRASGGLIEKYIGDAVVAVFGAVDNEIDHPARAQRAALAILGALDRENERIAERTVAISRCGSGSTRASPSRARSAIARASSASSAMPSTCRAARAGCRAVRVLVGDATYRLSPGLFAYEPHPPVAAKGKTAPLVAWRLLRLETATVDLGRAPLIGRDAEVAALVGALEEALSGKGHIVSIVGEAGLGKTRLVDELLADPRALGARVARARCSPYDSHRAYGAISDLLRRALAIGKTRPPRSRIAPSPRRFRDGTETAKLVLAALGYSLTLPPLSGETRRKLLDRAIRDLILRVARTQPVILALSDVQWADSASQDLLAALAPALANTAALLITTYRPELNPPWSTSRGHLQIRLTPLAPRAAAALLEALLPQARSRRRPSTTSSLQRGKPDIHRETARWLVATGVVWSARVPRPLPTSRACASFPRGFQCCYCVARSRPSVRKSAFFKRPL